MSTTETGGQVLSPGDESIHVMQAKIHYTSLRQNQIINRGPLDGKIARQYAICILAMST